MTTHTYSCSRVLWDPQCANIALSRSPVTGPADGGECAIMTAGDARVKPPSLIALGKLLDRKGNVVGTPRRDVSRRRRPPTRQRQVSPFEARADVETPFYLCMPPGGGDGLMERFS
jgi:hypothetical protein